LFSRPADDLLKFAGPILVVHGTADDSVPIGSARALRDEFARVGKTNLKFVEIPGVDHRFCDAKTGEAKLPLVEVAVVEWLGKQGVLGQEEAQVYLERVRAAHKGLFPEKAGASGG
jgi:pimeloyl-ACP methyl ester carboxylesterase